jgi:HAE1 family hydrophobic/amphiphilic exporter-1
MSLRSRLLVVLACLAFASASQPVAAGAPDSGGVPESGPAGAPLLHGRLELSLEDAIRMGLENNLDVAVERYSPFIAWEDTRIAWGAYDPQFFGEYNYVRSEEPNANILVGGRSNVTRVNGGDGGFRGMLPLLNGEFELSFGSDRTRTTVSVEALSPQLESQWSASLRQPLLRDLVWNETWTRVRATRVIFDASLEDFRRQVMDTVLAIEGAYWALVANEEQRRVAQKSLETARALLDQTSTQFEVGVVSRVEVVESEAGVAGREFNLIEAENRYRNAQDTLIDRVLGPGLRAESTLEVTPTDRPQDYVPYDIDRELAVQTAFEQRPELAIADDEIERRRIDLKFRKSQRLPQLDGVLSYGNKGLAGVQNPSLNCRFLGDPALIAACNAGQTVIPPTDYGTTFDNWMQEAAAEQFTAGGILTIPLGNVAGRHGVGQGELELRKAQTARRRLEQAIILQVRDAVRNLLSAQEGIEASRRARLAAEEQLRSARIRLEYGESTPFDVLLREEDFAQAESDEIRAFQVYRTSASSLDRAQGTILRSHNIEIDDVRALR